MKHFFYDKSCTTSQWGERQTLDVVRGRELAHYMAKIKLSLNITTKGEHGVN